MSLRLHPVTTMGCATTAGIKRGNLALPIFLKVCNTTSEVCNLRVKEEPQQPGTYKLFFCYYTSMKILTCFLSFQLVAVCFIGYLNQLRFFTTVPD